MLDPKLSPDFREEPLDFLAGFGRAWSRAAPLVLRHPVERTFGCVVVEISGQNHRPMVVQSHQEGLVPSRVTRRPEDDQ